MTIDGDRDLNGEGGGEAWVGHTLLVRRWQEMKREILVHKWYESEKAGHDIGFDRAALDWMIRFGKDSADNG
jgi:hypothetical protein